MTANKRTKPTSAANKSASTPKTTRKRLAAIKLEPFETFEQEDAPTVRRKAGRPKGSGKYGEETKPMRIPVSMVERIEAFIERKGLQCRLYNEQIQAGFPSPSEDSPFEFLDLAEYLIEPGVDLPRTLPAIDARRAFPERPHRRSQRGRRTGASSSRRSTGILPSSGCSRP